MDLNKGISDIQYDSLNLPRLLDVKNRNAEGRYEYTYSALGMKLKVVQRLDSGYSSNPLIGSTINTAALDITKITDYVGNIIYEDKFFPVLSAFGQKGQDSRRFSDVYYLLKMGV